MARESCGDGIRAYEQEHGIDMRNATIVGDQTVSGQVPFGTFRADRFKLDRHAREVFLFGNVRMSLDQRGKLRS